MRSSEPLSTSNRRGRFSIRASILVTAVVGVTSASTASADELEQGPVLAEPGFTLGASSWKDAAKAAGRPFVVFEGKDGHFYQGATQLDGPALKAILPRAFVAIQPRNVFSGTERKWPEFEEALTQIHAAVPSVAIGVETHSQGATVVVPQLVEYLKNHPDVAIGNVHLNAPLTRGSFMADVGARVFPLKAGREASGEMRSGTQLSPAIHELQGVIHGSVSMATPVTATTVVRGTEDGKLHFQRGGDGFVTRRGNTVSGVPNEAIHSIGKGPVWSALGKTPIAHLMSNRAPEAVRAGNIAMSRPLKPQAPPASRLR